MKFNEAMGANIGAYLEISNNWATICIYREHDAFYLSEDVNMSIAHTPFSTLEAALEMALEILAKFAL